MKTVVVPVGELDRAARGDHGGGMIADFGVIGDIRGAGILRCIGADGGFVFAVGTNGERGLREDRFEGRLFIDEQIACAGTDENLDAGRAFCLFQLCNVCRCRADIETVVDQALRRGERQLVVQRGDGSRRWVRIRHFQVGRYASLGAGSRRRVQIFLVRQPRLAEVNLVINHARHQVQAVSINHLIRGGMLRGVDVRDLVVLDEDVRANGFVRQDDLSVADEGFHILNVAEFARIPRCA
jgi:hypothetical protein